MEKYENRLVARADQIEERWHENLYKMKEGLQDKWDEIRKGIDTAKDEVESLQSQLVSAKEALDAELKTIARNYRTTLAVEAPSTFWTEKQDAHLKAVRMWTKYWALAASAGALLTAVTFISGLMWFFTPQWTLIADSTAAYAFLLPSAFLAFLTIWVLRIISRQLLANLALSSDAAERVTMVKTFLTLMEKPDHVKEPDRILVLSALFRPSSKSNDDDAPPNWFDLLMSRIKGP